MQAFTFDTPTAQFVSAFAIPVMGVAVWLLLRHRGALHPGLNAWCGAAVLLGAGFVLWAMRGRVPDLLSVYVAWALLLATFPLRLCALRLLVGEPPRASREWVMVGIGWAVFAFAAARSPDLRMQAVRTMLGAADLWLAFNALAIGRRHRLRGAVAIGIGHAVFGVAVLALALENYPEAFPNRPLLSIASLAGIAACVLDSIGYVAIAESLAHRREREQEAAREREAARRNAAEAQARSLLDLLAEREAMLHLLAHEVRQPLNNASAALQSAQGALVSATADPAEVRERLLRGEAVLGEIVGVLDNTLAAATVLGGGERVTPADTDLPMLFSLVAGDLPAAERPRVRVEWQTQARTVELDAGLMRLALRNVVRNALAYSPPGSPVVMAVREVDEPLGLVIEVADRGPGIPPEAATRVLEHDGQPPARPPGHGLGLYVVRRVADLHGGSVELLRAEGGGALVRLWLPQGRV